jgi:hypothetical protein
VAVIRTKLFWIGPFGFGGAIGTGTGTTACAGGLDLGGPGGGTGVLSWASRTGLDLDGPGGGTGVLSWASKTGPSNKVPQIRIRIRFMGEKAANLNSVLENEIRIYINKWPFRTQQTR